MGGIVVVINPHAGGRRTQDRWPAWREVLFEQLGTFETRFTAARGEATVLTRSALEAGADLVVALGGDGTINEVVNGFFERDGGDRPISPTAALGLLPSGTGSDFARTLGITSDFAAAAARLHAGRPRPVDVGRLRFIGPAGESLSRYFINVASFGIGGLVDRYVDASSKRLGGRASFALATLKAGLHYRNPEVRITLDGERPLEGRIYNVAVANGRFGGGMMVAPAAELDDGQFNVVMMGDMHLYDLVLHGADIYRGRHIRHPKVRVERAAHILALPLHEGEEVLLNVDGEQPGRLPATFEILPNALTVRGAGPGALKAQGDRPAPGNAP